MRRRLFAFFTIISLFPLLWAPVAAQSEGLVPVGRTVGLELQMDGVYVVKFDSDDGTSPAEAAGLQVGDRIRAVDGAPMHRAEELRQRVEASRGEALLFLVERDGKALSFPVLPVSEPGGWRIGVYVRDRIRGLGTVTFFDPGSGLFGALGHGVNDSSGACLSILGGLATETEIASVRKGISGTPGALQGGVQPGPCLGRVEENTPRGIFGTAEEGIWDGDCLPVAAREEITTGPAEIWCNVEGREIRHYTAEIEALRFEAEPGKNLRIRITDEALLAKTGGIVQGMSGSPIIQNGKLVGAVTHVLVRDPTRGYGILLENMLEASRLWNEACPEAA